MKRTYLITSNEKANVLEMKTALDKISRKYAFFYWTSTYRTRDIEGIL